MRHKARSRQKGHHKDRGCNIRASHVDNAAIFKTHCSSDFEGYLSTSENRAVLYAAPQLDWLVAFKSQDVGKALAAGQNSCSKTLAAQLATRPF